MSFVEEPAKKPLFVDFDADKIDNETTEIESLCLNCGKNGMTRLLLTKIPLYKEIILTSFNCTHCDYTNNQTQFGGKFQECGIKVTLKVETQKDLNRQVVVSDYATINIPELDLEMPPISRNGEVSTVEGILDRACSNLEAGQNERREADPESADKIETFLTRLRGCRDLETSFHIVLRDPSGNSFIENLYLPYKDKTVESVPFKRSRKEDNLLGIVEDDDEAEAATPEHAATDDNVSDEVLTFNSNCFSCNAPCETNMKVTKIPHFKEVVIMATTCSVCGHRSNEVKAGSGIEPQGVRISLHITDPVDFTRDVLKSETCHLEIPELDFEMGAGILGGRFTTLEGLIENVKEQLLEDNPLIVGDSVSGDVPRRIADFVRRLERIQSCADDAHLVLDDPAGNSYIQNLYAPETDPELDVTWYDRSVEQNDELGLTHMKTENY